MTARTRASSMFLFIFLFLTCTFYFLHFCFLRAAYFSFSFLCAVTLCFLRILAGLPISHLTGFYIPLRFGFSLEWWRKGEVGLLWISGGRWRDMDTFCEKRGIFKRKIPLPYLPALACLTGLPPSSLSFPLYHKKAWVRLGVSNVNLSDSGSLSPSIHVISGRQCPSPSDDVRSL